MCKAVRSKGDQHFVLFDPFDLGITGLSAFTPRLVASLNKLKSQLLRSSITESKVY